MNNVLELEYLDIIADLKQLKHLVPSSELRNRVYRLTASLPTLHHFHPLPLLPMKLALILLIFFAFASSNLVVLTQNSQPGQFLYPLNLLSHKFSGAKEIVTVSPQPVERPENLAQDPPDGGSPAPSLNPKNVGGTEVVLPLIPQASPSTLSASGAPAAVLPTPQVEGDVNLSVSVSVDSHVVSSPSPTLTPSSPTPVIDLPLLDVDQTETGLELKIGKENKPLIKIGL